MATGFQLPFEPFMNDDRKVWTLRLGSLPCHSILLINLRQHGEFKKFQLQKLQIVLWCYEEGLHCLPGE